MDFSQRNHIFALETLSCAHTCLIGLPHASLVKVLDERYEDVFGVVLFEGSVGIGGNLPVVDLLILRMFGGLLASVGVDIKV